MTKTRSAFGASKVMRIHEQVDELFRWLADPNFAVRGKDRQVRRQINQAVCKHRNAGAYCVDDGS